MKKYGVFCLIGVALACGGSQGDPNDPPASPQEAVDRAGAGDVGRAAGADACATFETAFGELFDPSEAEVAIRAVEQRCSADGARAFGRAQWVMA